MPPPRATIRAWRSDAGPLVFVWGTWLALSVAVIDFVRTYTVDFPYFDEWDLVPAITGQQPVTLRWLWSLHNEHRIVIPRVLFLILGRFSGYDFGAGALFNACILAAAAAALIATARRLRGHTAYSDAFFALVLLNWGQTENLVWSFQVQFVISSALTIAVLLLIVRPGPMTLRAALGLGVCTLLLPLVGGTGVAFVPALAVCILLAGRDVRGTAAGGRRWALVVWGLGLLAVALTALYFVDYERPAMHPPSPSVGVTFDGALQFLTMGLGAAAKGAWPVTQYVLLILLGATVLALCREIVAGTERHREALRLVIFIGAMCSLALGVAWARTALAADAMFVSRYATLAAPLGCAMYFAWQLIGSPALGRFVQVVLFCSALLLLIPNDQYGIQEGTLYRDLRANVVADLRAGVPVGELVKRHYAEMYYAGPDVLEARMRSLRAHGIGVFKELRE